MQWRAVAGSDGHQIGWARLAAAWLFAGQSGQTPPSDSGWKSRPNWRDRLFSGLACVTCRSLVKKLW